MSDDSRLKEFQEANKIVFDPSTRSVWENQDKQQQQQQQQQQEEANNSEEQEEAKQEDEHATTSGIVPTLQNIVATVNSVSYTHLDVYKRQLAAPIGFATANYSR